LHLFTNSGNHSFTWKLINWAICPFMYSPTLKSTSTHSSVHSPIHPSNQPANHFSFNPFACPYAIPN
jgi:hypothetical protein